MAIIIGGPNSEVLPGDVFGVPAGDLIFGNDGNDVLFGLFGSDLLFGGDQADRLFGADGNDTLEGGADQDFLDGGNGARDWASYAQAAGTVAVDLTVGQGFAGDAAGDQLVGIENLAGSGFNDRLRGDRVANEIVGGAGNDLIQGERANDTLRGDEGADTLVGGANNDVFRYHELNDSFLGLEDFIADFTQGQDVIDLRAIDAVVGGGDDPFFFGGAVFNGIAGELIAFFVGSNTRVQGDVNGDGAADLSILVAGNIPFVPVDFLL